jgi:ankyrin repeat protein
MEATISVHTEMVKILLENKADPNKANLYGNTPLLIAVNIADVAFLEKLQKGLGEHHHAEKPKIVEMLLDYGADPNVKGLSGETPLHIAARKNIPVLVTRLLGAGANPDLKDRNGKTPRDHMQTSMHPGKAGKQHQS